MAPTPTTDYSHALSALCARRPGSSRIGPTRGPTTCVTYASMVRCRVYRGHLENRARFARRGSRGFLSGRMLLRRESVAIASVTRRSLSSAVALNTAERERATRAKSFLTLGLDNSMLVTPRRDAPDSRDTIADRRSQRITLRVIAICHTR